MQEDTHNISSGTESYSSFQTFYYLSDGLIPSLDSFTLIFQSPHRLVKSPPFRELGCPIPLDNCFVPDPLVTSLSSMSNSSEENNIRYVLKNRKVLANSPFGFGREIGGYKGVGFQARVY